MDLHTSSEASVKLGADLAVLGVASAILGDAGGARREHDWVGDLHGERRREQGAAHVQGVRATHRHNALADARRSWRPYARLTTVIYFLALPSLALPSLAFA